MNKEKFWSIIDKVNSKVDKNDRESILTETKKELGKLSVKEILDWEAIKNIYLRISDTKALWCACAVINTYCMDDEFEYFRAWLISQGKEVFMTAIKEPDLLANIEVEKDEADFESYNYIAYDVLEAKIKDEAFGMNTRNRLSKEVIEDIYCEVIKNMEKTSTCNIKDANKIVPNLYRKFNIDFSMKM